MKLRTRIGVITLALCLLFGTALAGLLLLRSFRVDLSSEINRGLTSSDMFSASLTASLTAFSTLPEEDSASRAVRLTAQYMTDNAQVAVADARGRLLYDNFLQELAPLLDMMPAQGGEYSIRSLYGTPWLLIRRGINAQGDTYHLYYAWPLARVYNGARLQARTASLLLVALCAALAVGLWVALRASFSPLRRVEKAASGIAQGDYDTRAPVVHAHDEAGQLALAFNRMAASTQEHVERLTRQDAAQKQFIADMAHELKTPMTSMIGYADLLRRTQVTENQRQEALSAIVQQGERLERMGTKLLRLSGLDKGDALTLAEHRTDTLFGQAVQAVEGPRAEKGVNLLSEPGDFHWYCDGDLMVTLLQNLLSNAIRASEPGGRVWLTARADGLSVRDEGCGIPPEHLPHVTEAFYMVDKSRARAAQGAGLGLALCRRIAQLHKARLTIDSQPGQGTTVSLLFTTS